MVCFWIICIGGLFAVKYDCNIELLEYYSIIIYIII